MAIPQLTAAERQAALEKAKAARTKRAEIRDSLKSGKLTLKDVLGMKDDPIVGRMKVSRVLASARKPPFSSASPKGAFPCAREPSSCFPVLPERARAR